MAKYKFSYYEQESGYIYFEAENMEKAQELFDEVETGDIFIEDLPGYFKTVRSCEYELDDLEEAQ